MPDVIEGHLSGDGHRIGIVVSRFNDFITQRLLDGALDSLRRHGVDLSEVSVAWCPGSFEIPVTAKKMAESGRFDAVICLGAVIRGATAHFDYVAGGVAGGVARGAGDSGIPGACRVTRSHTRAPASRRARTD